MSEQNDLVAQELEALQYEKAGYARRGLSDRVAQVDSEIKRIAGLRVASHEVEPESEVEEAPKPKSRKQTRAAK